MPQVTTKSMVWPEPWFFCQRIRDRRDWLKAVIPAVLAAVAIIALLGIVQGRNLAWWQIGLWGLAIGGIVQLGIEAAFLQRNATLDDTTLTVDSAAGPVSSCFTYLLDQLDEVEIRRPAETGLPFAMLVFRGPTQGGIVGIPSSMILERLADALYRRNLPVALSGWNPPTNNRPAPYCYVRAAGITGPSAHVTEVLEAERSLSPLPHMLIALFISAWLMLVWLGLLVVCGILVYRNWQAIGGAGVLVAAIAGFSSLTIPFAYIELFGNYFSAAYLIRIAQRAALARRSAVMTSFEPPTACVELIARENWAALGPKVVDFGFLQIDDRGQRVLFEGNREQWIVPFDAIEHCELEEIPFGQAAAGAPGSLRFYVSFAFESSTGRREIGFRAADKRPGKETDVRKLDRSIALYDFLTAHLSKGNNPAPALVLPERVLIA